MYMCPVCGYPDLEEPPIVDGHGSYEICPSCGYEYGYDDEARGVSYEEWRDKWIKNGMLWWSRRASPKDWDPNKQLQNILE